MTSHASMNRIYRLVFNAALGIWVAVAENARGKGKGGRAACALLAVLAILSPAAHAANAADATLRGGMGTVTTVGNTTTIHQTSQRLALDWTQLSTAAGEALNFNQPNAQAIALNRITGSSPSSFLGSLTANGQVFILNPNGVLFGAGSQVNVGGIVASTLGMNPTDFMNGSNTFTRTTGTGSVVNQGTMTAAQGGYLALLAPEVRNEGVMTASLGTALLAAGNKITLNLDNGSLLGYSIDQGAVNALAENKQLIKADGGQVLLSARALDALTTATINNTGVIEAKTIQNIAGRIMLMGDMEYGAVNVGGTLDASATQGNGGFIETSAAKVKVADTARVTTKAQTGQTGTWLIDPTDFTIAATGGDITGAALGSQLANNNITLATPTTGAGNGDMLVNDSVSWASNNSLTLNAQRNIDFSGGGSLNASGATSRVNLYAGQGGVGAVIGGAGVAVTANTLSIDAATGIGSAANALQTSVANLRLNNTTSGGVYAHNAKDVTVAANSVNGDVRVTTSAGVAAVDTNTIDPNTGYQIFIAPTNGAAITVGTVAGMSGITTTGTGSVSLSTGAGGAGSGATLDGVGGLTGLPANGDGGKITVSQSINTGGNIVLQGGVGGGDGGAAAAFTSGGAGGNVEVNASLTATGAVTLAGGRGANTNNANPGSSITYAPSKGGNVLLNARLQAGTSATLAGGSGGTPNDGTGNENATDGGSGGSVTTTTQGVISVTGAIGSVLLQGGAGGNGASAGQYAAGPGGVGGSVVAGGSITAGGNVALLAGSGGSGTFNLSSSDLAGGSVTTHAAISAGVGGTGNLSLVAGNGNVLTNSGAYLGNSGGSVTANGSLSATGNVVVTAGNARNGHNGPAPAVGMAGGSVLLGGSVSAGGNATITAGSGATVTITNQNNAGFDANGGNGGSITVNGGMSVGGNATLTAGARGLGNNGNATHGMAGNIAVNSNITSSGNANLSAGAVTSSAGATIAANTLSIDAATGIGSAANALQTNLNNLRLNNTTSGGIYAHNAKDVTVAANSVNGDVRITTANGANDQFTGIEIAATNGGSITVGTVAGMSGITATGTGNVTLTTGSGGNREATSGTDPGFGGSIRVDQAVAAGGSVGLYAGMSGAGGFGGFAGVTGNAGGSIAVNAGITAGANATLAAGGAPDLIDPIGGRAGSGGGITLNALLQTGGSASLAAGNGGMAPIDEVNLENNFAWGGAGGSVVVTALGRLNAGTSGKLTAGAGGSNLTLAEAQAGSGGSVTSHGTLTAGTDLLLRAGDGGRTVGSNHPHFAQGTGGSVTTHALVQAGNNLTLRAGHGGTSRGSVSNVAATAGSVTAHASLIAGANALLVAGNGGALTGVVGNGANGGSVALNGGLTVGGNATLAGGAGGAGVTAGVAGNIAFNSNITATGNANLTAGAVTSSAGGSIAANTLSIDAATGIGSAANPLQTNVNNLRLNNTTSGGVYANNAKDVTVAARSVGGDVRISTAAGVDDVADPISGEFVSAAINGGSITVGTVAGMNGITATGTGSVTLATGAGGSAIDGLGTNAKAGGAITIDQTITAGGSVNLLAGMAGAGNLGSGGNIAVNAAVTAGANATLTGGAAPDRLASSGSAGAGGSITLNALLQTVGFASVAAGNGGTVPDGSEFAGARGGAGGSVTVTAQGRVNAGTSATLAGGTGGAYLDINTSNGGSGGSVTSSGTLVAGTDLLLQGGHGGDAARGNNTFDAAGGSVTTHAAVQAGNHLTLRAGNGGIGAGTGGSSGSVTANASLMAGGNALLAAGNGGNGQASNRAGGQVLLNAPLRAVGSASLVAGNGGGGVGAVRGGTGGAVQVNATVTSGTHATLIAGLGGSGATVGAGGDVSLAAAVSAAATGDALRISGRNFANTAGANALTAANGRWLVWTQSPVGNTFGGLMSNNAAIWNTAYNAASPTVASAGNRFVFGDAGAALVTANNTSKTYGDVFTGSYGYTAVVAGGQDFGNAFTDARGAAVALTGRAPTYSSAGAAATATRTGGNAGGAGYDINIDITGATAAGYSLLAGKGLLTVNARPLIVTANNDVRIAGSAPYSGGNGVQYSGLVASESAAVLGGMLTYGGSSQGASAVGAYDITPGGLTSTNYGVSFVNGGLQIVPSGTAVPAVASPVITATVKTTDPIVAALGSAPLVPAYQAVLQGVAGVSGFSAGASATGGSTGGSGGGGSGAGGNTGGPVFLFAPSAEE